MADTRTLALRLGALRGLQDKVKEAYERTRAEMAAAFDPGDRKAAILPTGKSIGTVSYSNGRTAAKVANERAFFAWVVANAPGEVETVSSVRESYRKALLDRVKAGPDETAVDPKTGEVVPGLKFSTSDPYVSVRQSDEQLAALANAWASGELDVIGLAALAAADDTEEAPNA